MSIITAYSSKKIPGEIVEEIKTRLRDTDTRFLIYFASSEQDQSRLAKAMHEAFSPADVIGCSTAGEIVSGKMLKGSVVAMSLSKEEIHDVKVEVVSNISDGVDISPNFSAFEEYFGEPMDTMDFRKYVGIVLVDGLRGTEENLMDSIGDQTNVIFVGGSAGDDLNFKTTHVYKNGESLTNAAVLALLQPAKGFDFIKTQSFTPLDKTLTVTKANQSAREVIEFNGKPAAEAYAESLGVSPAEAPNLFMTNPVGLLIDGEPYVRSPQQINNNTMAFYCNVLEGMELAVLKSTDIVKDTREAVNRKEQELGSISGIINFNCILRTLELENKGQTENYGKIFSKIPTIGFSTYGEEYLGHINQTSTMLAFR